MTIKVEYVFCTEDYKSFYSVIEEYNQNGEYRAYNRAKVEFDKLGEDTENMRLYEILLID